MTDAYTLLGVAPGASELEVRRAYRRLARALHPDLQPEHLREQSGRRLQAVNAARTQVLDDLRRRRETRASEGVFVPGQRRPTESPSGAEDTTSRWAEHHEWLHEQQRDIDDWNDQRRAREQRRRQVWEQHLQDQRRSVRPRHVSSLVTLAVAGLLAGLLWGSAHVVEHVVAAVTTDQPSFTFVPDSGDLDLRDVLALLGSWRS
jgi:hypothetical protein